MIASSQVLLVRSLASLVNHAYAPGIKILCPKTSGTVYPCSCSLSILNPDNFPALTMLMRNSSSSTPNPAPPRTLTKQAAGLRRLSTFLFNIPLVSLLVSKQLNTKSERLTTSSRDSFEYGTAFPLRLQ